MPIKSFNSIGTQKHMIAFKINKSINCVLRLHAHQFYLDSIKITILSAHTNAHTHTRTAVRRTQPSDKVKRLQQA